MVYGTLDTVKACGPFLYKKIKNGFKCLRLLDGYVHTVRYVLLPFEYRSMPLFVVNQWSDDQRFKTSSTQSSQINLCLLVT